MASITADWTGVVPQWLQTTQPIIIQRFLEETGFGWTGTTSTISTSTITDSTMLQSTTASDEEWKGGWVRMSGGTSANLGAIRAIRAHSNDDGTLTVSPVLPAATASGDAYEVWMTPMHPAIVLNILNRLTAQHGLYLPTYTFLSEIPDYDMEQTGTAAWTSTNATIAKVASTAGNEGVNGKYAMSVTTTSANGYATSQRGYGVNPGSSYWLSAQFTPSNPAVTNTAFLQLYDETNGQVLETLTTSAKRTVRLAKMVGVGDSGYVNVRYGSEESGVTGIWDEVVALDAASKDIALPYWMGTQSALKEVYVWRPARMGQGADEYDPAALGDVSNDWQPYADAFSNGGQLRLKTGTSNIHSMLVVNGVRAETSWASLTDVKHIDVAWATAALALNVYQRTIGQTITSAEGYDHLQDRAAYWNDQFTKHDRRVRSARRTNDSGPTQWVRM